MAMTADVWATALSVLEADGFALLPDGVEALMVTGSERDFQILATAGCRALIAEPVPEEVKVWTGEKPQPEAEASAADVP